MLLLFCLLLGIVVPYADCASVSTSFTLRAMPTAMFFTLQLLSAIASAGIVYNDSTYSIVESANFNRLHCSSRSMSNFTDCHHAKQLQPCAASVQHSGHVCWLSSTNQILPYIGRVTSCKWVHCTAGKSPSCSFHLTPALLALQLQIYSMLHSLW